MTSEDSALSRRGFLKLFVLGPLLLQCPFPDLAFEPAHAITAPEMEAVKRLMIDNLFNPNPVFAWLSQRGVA